MTYGFMNVRIQDAEPGTIWRDKEGHVKSTEVVISARMNSTFRIPTTIKDANVDALDGHTVNLLPLFAEYRRYPEFCTEARYLLRDKNMIINVWGQKGHPDINEILSVRAVSSYHDNLQVNREKSFDNQEHPFGYIYVNVWGLQNNCTQIVYEAHCRRTVVKLEIDEESLIESFKRPARIEDNPLSLYVHDNNIDQEDIDRLMEEYDVIQTDGEMVEKTPVAPHNEEVRENAETSFNLPETII